MAIGLLLTLQIHWKIVGRLGALYTILISRTGGKNATSILSSKVKRPQVQGQEAIGNVKLNILPLPSSLSTQMVPPFDSMKFLVM